MIKLTRLNVHSVDPSLNEKGKVQFTTSDIYVSKDMIKMASVVNNDPTIMDNWKDIKVKKYCEENNIKMCVIYANSSLPYLTNIIMDDVVENLINSID